MENLKYQRAAKRVKELKGFYGHVKIFVIVNLFLLILKGKLLHSYLPIDLPTEDYFYDWIYGNLFVWLVLLIIHGLLLFRNKITFFKDWEKKQIQRYMEKEKQEEQKYR
jgi:hypothetical protein